MSDDERGRATDRVAGLSRRTVLRGGAVGTGALALGAFGVRAGADDGAETTADAVGTTVGVGSVESKLTASDGDDDDAFGDGVALDGDTALVGTPGDEDPNGSDAGAAYVYENDGGTWRERAKLAPCDGDDGDHFGAAVALSGDTAVVGAPGDEDPNGTDAGSAYVYTRRGKVWSLATKLVASDGASGDQFGWTVAVDGDTAAVGARQAEVSDPQLGQVGAGATYVYTRSGGAWSRQAKLVVSDAPNDDLVSAVALDGDTLLVGDAGDTVTGGDVSGAAYVFERSGGSWASPTKFTATDNDRDDSFGQAVSLAGDTALVGAPGDEDPNGMFAGSAYVFVRSGGSWTQQEKLAPGDGERGDEFGEAVAVDGDTAIVGTQADDDPPGGAVYEFTRSGTTWSGAGTLTPSDGDADDDFGQAVALDGDTAVVGAPNDEDPNGSGAGSVYAFEPPQLSVVPFDVLPDPLVPGQPALFDASASSNPGRIIETYAWDFDGDGTVDETTSGPTVAYTFADGGRRVVTLRVTGDDGATATTTREVTVPYRPPIVIRPGADRAPINPRSEAPIRVAIVSTDALHAPEQVDVGSVRFGPADEVGFDGDQPYGGAEPLDEGEAADVDGDGRDDLILRFPPRETGFDADDTTGALVGLTVDGIPLSGTDAVRVVGSGGGGGRGAGGGGRRR